MVAAAACSRYLLLLLLLQICLLVYIYRQHASIPSEPAPSSMHRMLAAKGGCGVSSGKKNEGYLLKIMLAIIKQKTSIV